ncbi:hypothetical protein BH09MYX1_BH09MYX1_34560 [soil metagenome]
MHKRTSSFRAVRNVAFAAIVLAPIALFAPACGTSVDTAAPGPVHSIFVTPASLSELSEATFLDHPFPSDLRRESDGTVRFEGFYNPTANVLVEDYIASGKKLLTGFSPVAAIYVRFDGDIDPSNFPVDPPASIAPTSVLQIVDVDPASPDVGKRMQLSWFLRAKEGLFWMKDTLAVAPAQGQPLATHRKYALVVTRGVKAANGLAVEPSKDLAEVLGQTAATARTAATRTIYDPAVAALATAGIAAKDIVQLTVFTTNDPTDELFRVTDHAKTLPPPKATDSAWVAKEQKTTFDVYEGSYGPVPNYQTGKLPFVDFGDGGGFTFDANGKPVVQNTVDMRCALAVPVEPACPMPADGYPIVLYAHGTGGNYRSAIQEAHGATSILPGLCVAVMGVDQIFHGTRPGAPDPNDPNAEGIIQLLFFNFANPIAARTNGRQSSVDTTVQARLFTEQATRLTVPAAVAHTAKDIVFDGKKLVFFGHSQGGVNGPLFFAADDQARGGVLSGTGADLTVALLEKTKPAPSVAGAVRTLLGLNAAEYADELNLFHPVMNLAQTLVDAVDPLTYMRHIIREPRTGYARKSIYLTEGIGPDGEGDNYTPPHGIEIASVVLGLPRQLPGVRTISYATWAGLGDVTVPADGLSANLFGEASGVIAQFPPVSGSDGHFVVFDVPTARSQAAHFLRNLIDDPKGKVPFPQ